MNITAFIGAIIVGILTTIGVIRSHSPVKLQVLSKETTSKVVLTSTPAVSPKTTDSVTPQPTTGTSFAIDSFIYPNATKKEYASSQVSLESNDDPSTISSWYQNKINALSMGAKSVVSTKTNGNVNILLDAANNTTEVKITITKDAGDSKTTITVNISSHESNGSSGTINRTIINNNINTSTDTSNTY